MTGPLLALRRRNALTCASLAAGLLACTAAVAGDPESAAGLVAAAAIADAFDGRYAARFASDRLGHALGTQMDSLADACAFGMAPAICTIAATAATPRHAPLVWLAALAYLLCAVARLAFYTATSATQTGFIGVPAPAAALVWATTMLLTRGRDPLALSLAIAAAAMILPVHLSRPAGRGLALFALWAVTVIVAAFR